MGLGTTQQTNRTYLTISHGKVERTERGRKDTFSFVEGCICGILKVQRNYNGENVEKWLIDVADPESGEIYTLSFPYSSGVFKSIILALASYTELTAYTRVKVEPYEKGNFTNVNTYADGEKLDWVTKELPALEVIQVGGREIKDDTKRMELIAYYVTIIIARIKGATN